MARSFNGTTDFVAANAATIYTQSIACSFAAWVKASGSITNAVYYGEGNSGATNPFLQLQANSGKLRIFARGNVGTSSQINGVSSNGTIADNTWHHVIYAQGTSGSGNIYVDGAFDKSLTFSPSLTSLNNVTIGGLHRNAGLENPYAGAVAEMATWTRQLTAGEAASLGAGFPASHLGPTHYWPLWGVDSPEPDIGNG